jgi:hypothetical protein
MQPGEDPPVIENREKPSMDEGLPEPDSAGKPHMPEDVPAGEPVEPVATPPTSGEPAEAGQPLPPQEPRAAPAAAPQERYVRMRVRVRGDQLEVADSWVVESPLSRPERLHPGLVYEVAVGGEQVTFGSIPDAGVRRSFPPEEPTDEVKGHHIEELPSYEFPVRIPQQALSARALPEMRISVYRIKGPVPEQRALPMPLLDQFPTELRPVAELRGLRLDELPESVQEVLEGAPEP